MTKIPANNDDGTENEKLCSINGANVSFYGLHIKCKLLKRQQPETPDSQREREGKRGRERRATAACGEAVEQQQLLQYLESVCSCLLFSTFPSTLRTFFSPLSCPRGCTVCAACLLPAACSAPLPHYVACDTVNDYMYMLHATPSAQMGTGGTGAEQSGKVCSPPFGSFGLLGQPAPTPPTMKSVT